MVNNGHWLWLAVGNWNNIELVIVVNNHVSCGPAVNDNQLRSYVWLYGHGPSSWKDMLFVFLFAVGGVIVVALFDFWGPCTVARKTCGRRFGHGLFPQRWRNVEIAEAVWDLQGYVSAAFRQLGQEHWWITEQCCAGGDVVGGYNWGVQGRWCSHWILFDFSDVIATHGTSWDCPEMVKVTSKPADVNSCQWWTREFWDGILGCFMHGLLYIFFWKAPGSCSSELRGLLLQRPAASCECTTTTLATILVWDVPRVCVATPGMHILSAIEMMLVQIIMALSDLQGFDGLIYY